MGKKLYAGNLSHAVMEQALPSMFAKHGTIESVSRW